MRVQGAWQDQSQDGARWIIDSSEYQEKESSSGHPPHPSTGRFCLLLKSSSACFSVGILSSAMFVAIPGDEIQFDYWITSKYPELNNIQV